MRGLAVLAEDEFSHGALRTFYDEVQRREPNQEADALAYQCVVMSMHDASAVQSMADAIDPYPMVRSAIISWYYATYYAAKAMLAACSGADPQTHTSTARCWQSEIVENSLAKHPFDLSISDIRPVHVGEVLTRAC